MREILFKAKRIDNGEWVEGDLVHSVYKINDVCVGKYGSEIGMLQVNPDTICQYTGLTDKNGNKIWENDIIKDSDGDIGIIKYGMDGRASFVVYYEKKNEYILLGENNIEMLKIEVEKQIPKKPDFEGDGYWNGQLVYDTWICPNCEKRYEVDYEEYDHCPNCEQKIDWSEVEEC